MSIRDIGINAISTIIQKQKNVELLEKYIFTYTVNETEYIDVLYTSIYKLQTSSNRTQCLKDLITQLYNNHHNWNDQIYRTYKEKLEEEDHFITNPFEIEEGVLECKCGSKRTISFQRQTRSADEGSTTFAQCVECGNRWRHNN
jgi:DNA-directed RNA polymerase subunit M/transcription elongation factor TFIIS